MGMSSDLYFINISTCTTVAYILPSCLYSISHDAPVTYPCQWYHVTWLPGDVFAYSTLNIMGSQSTLGLLHIQDDKLQAG